MKCTLVLTAALSLLSGAFASCGGGASRNTGRDSARAASARDTTRFDFTATSAARWDSLFYRDHGWFGADGIFSIPLRGVDTASTSDSTMFVFSDTMIGDIVDGKLRPGFTMVHNTVAYIAGSAPDSSRIRFYWKTDAKGRPTSMFTPRTPAASDSDYYWLGDGFVNHARGDSIYLFAYRIRNISDKDFGFREVGNVVIVIPPGSRPPFTDQRQMDTPLYLEGDSASGDGSFGGAILVNTKAAGAASPDGYVYVYGVKGQRKNVLVARVTPAAFTDFSAWRFWDGKGWSRDIDSSAPIADRASNELSVSRLPDGRYAMVFQTDGLGSTVGLRLGLSPRGPFGPVIKLWDCPEVKENKHFVTYNAKAHPALSQPGELLISYNVNAFDFFHVITVYPHLYRPRFIRVAYH